MSQTLQTKVKRVDIVSATVPPYVCGIGDYTARLANVLKPFADVRLLSGQTTYDANPGVTIESVFSRDDKNSIWNVAKFVESSPPDWLVVQYAPDTLVNRGLTPLAPMLKSVRRAHPTIKVAVMVHEWNCAATDLKSRLKDFLLRSQFRAVGKNADHLLFSVEAWADQTRRWFPGTPCTFMPVGSAMPHLHCTRQDAKKRLGINEDAFVIGLFGRLNETCDLDWCVRAIKEIARVKPNVVVVYIGIFGELLKEALQGSVPIVEGAVAPDEVSLRMAAMDLFLLADREGASARRTRLMTSLQHGIATLTTQSNTTDAVLSSANKKALLLVPSDDREAFVSQAVALAEHATVRQDLEHRATSYYEANFSWEHIQELWVKTLSLQTG